MMNSKFKTIGIASLVGLAAIEALRRYCRWRGQKKLQKQVTETAPDPVKNNLSISEDNIQISIIKKHLDLTQYKEVPMSENESNEWRALISTFGGELSKAALNVNGFANLVKCDVPLKDLCRIKDNPELMRGFVVNNGKISRHASFSKIGFDKIAPLMVYQCLAIVTSQYYQQIITKQLNLIDSKITNIIHILKADDRAKLRVAYNRFVELSKKTKYDVADKQIVSNFSSYVEIIREKYRELLSGIGNFNINYKWSDKKEACLKIQKLQESHYFEYLDMTMQAEFLYFIASIISIKVAIFLGNSEDAEIYSKRLNLDVWGQYVDQFNQIKHDVVKYLELETDSSWFQTNSIRALKDEQLKKFNDFETDMLKLQNRYEYRTVQYIHEDNGRLKKYISLSQ